MSKQTCSQEIIGERGSMVRCKEIATYFFPNSPDYYPVYCEKHAPTMSHPFTYEYRVRQEIQEVYTELALRFRKDCEKLVEKFTEELDHEIKEIFFNQKL
jgi:hypothetical protein